MIFLDSSLQQNVFLYKMHEIKVLNTALFNI